MALAVAGAAGVGFGLYAISSGFGDLGQWLILIGCLALIAGIITR